MLAAARTQSAAGKAANKTRLVCIEQVHGAPVLRLRSRLLPLVYLASELGGEVAAADKDATP